MVLAALYLRRLKRRSTTAWMRRWAGWNRAATARVAPATAQLGRIPSDPRTAAPGPRRRRRHPAGDPHPVPFGRSGSRPDPDTSALTKEYEVDRYLGCAPACAKFR